MFSVENRRYVGNKFKLMEWIKEMIIAECENCNSFFDVFAGTGSVSKYLIDCYDRLILNDFLYSNEVIYKAFFENKDYDCKKLELIKDEYNTYQSYSDTNAYYDYMGIIDNNILDIEESVQVDVSDVRKATLYKYAKEYSKEQVFDELMKVCNKKDSKDPMLKFINAPTRLEFLTSIALVQGFEGLDVNPNYSVDDEGLPTFTAGGGVADIVCIDTSCDSFFEVTLMCGRQDQVNNEIVPIRRHLKEYISQNQPKQAFSVFVAPVVHEDTKEVAMLYKLRENLDIMTYDINDFISKVDSSTKVSQFLAS